MTITIRLPDELESKIREQSVNEMITMTTVITRVMTQYYTFGKIADDAQFHAIPSQIVAMYHDNDFLTQVLSGKPISREYLSILASYPERFYIGTIGNSKSRTPKAKQIRRKEVIRVIELVLDNMHTLFKKREIGIPFDQQDTVFTISHSMGNTYSTALSIMFSEFLRIHGFTYTTDISATNLIIRIEK